MAVFIVLWPYLLTTKLRCLQKNNIGHTIIHIKNGQNLFNNIYRYNMAISVLKFPGEGCKIAQILAKNNYTLVAVLNSNSNSIYVSSESAALLGKNCEKPNTIHRSDNKVATILIEIMSLHFVSRIFLKKNISIQEKIME